MRRGVISLANDLKENFKKKCPVILYFGGCISCDGMKIMFTRRKYYNLVINFIEMKRRKGGGHDWVNRTKLLLLTRHTGLESAELIRSNLCSGLKVSTGKFLFDSKSPSHL